MANLLEIPTFNEDGDVHVVVESPRGTNVKLAYDPKLGAFTMRRVLVLGALYPFDWGFVPSTEASDGDPLDAMVIFDGSTYPGVVLACRPIGVVRVSQKARGKGASGRGNRERNDRVIAVPVNAARFDHLKKVQDLDPRTRDEVKQFFETATLLEDKGVKLLGWGDAREARKAIEDARTGR